MKLHLGCGQCRLQGYINIDFPLTEHTVQTESVADLHLDIRRMDLVAETVSEVRLHHVFEHFPRVEALALLLRWNKWLVTGGKLTIETPDFEKSIKLLRKPWISQRRKCAISRHVFGSQEASWANHYDGWSAWRYRRLLPKLGFTNIRFTRSRWKDTCNITVNAVKESTVSPSDWTKLAKDILRDFTIDNSSTEEKLLSIWLDNFEKFIEDVKIEKIITSNP